jgi:hypothetical protein
MFTGGGGGIVLPLVSIMVTTFKHTIYCTKLLSCCFVVSNVTLWAVNGTGH